MAGSDTVSQGSTALFRHIVGDKTIQTRLRAEINAAFDVGDDYDSVKLAKLPFLDACIQEMLRLVPLSLLVRLLNVFTCSAQQSSVNTHGNYNRATPL